MTTKYISIKSVLYDLSLTIDDRYWNELRMLEWITHGLRQLNVEDVLEQKVCLIDVVSHKAQLPQDLKYLTQVAYYYGTENCCPEINENLATPSTYIGCQEEQLKWKTMRLTSNPYHNSICADKQLLYCTDCDHEFSVSTTLVLTTTLSHGTIMVSYLGYPMEDGYQLIPDDETLKEALLHYVLYRYWLSKFTMREQGSDQNMKFHLSMWNMLAMKASGNLNLPDVNQLENLKAQHNRILRRENKFQQLFLTLGNRENINNV